MRKSITEIEYKKLCKEINPNSPSRFSEQIEHLKLKNNTKIESLHIQCVILVKEHLEKSLIFLIPCQLYFKPVNFQEFQ